MSELRKEVKTTIVYTENEIGDHVFCSNCGGVFLLDLGTESCPQCNKIGCLQWVNDDEPEKTVEDIEKDFEVITKNQLHDFEPTDNQGHAMECTKCGKYISVYYPEEWNKALSEKCDK